MRKLTLLLGLVVGLALVAIAAAAPPTHETFPFSGTESDPAGTTCDFNYSLAFSGTDEVTTFSNGRVQVHSKFTITHTNDDTGYALTENGQVNTTFDPAGGAKSVGVFWHLRDASGKLVVVHAGQLVFDPGGTLVKYTPNSGPDFAAVICPALGGNPAP
jgi:hypothetical protein